MAKQERCPGCGRHCPMSDVRCKYGQKYFEKMQKKAVCEANPKDGKHRKKWEKYVEREGLLWILLRVGSKSKKALRKRKSTERELLSVLDEQEQAQLRALLERMAESLQ